MNLLTIILTVFFSFLLALVPATVLKKDKLKFSIVLSFFAILSAGFVGGLIYSIPITIIITLFSLWIRFVGCSTSKPKRILFMITIVLSALFLGQHLVHLPIRCYLNQTNLKIASNVVGIIIAAFMLSTVVELTVLRKRNKG